MHDTSSDQQLIRLILEGQSDLFRYLIARYNAEIHNFCLARLTDADEAVDATQDIFIKAYRSLHRFDQARAFKPWLYSICLNYLKNRYWHRSRQKELYNKLEQTARLQADNAVPSDDPEQLILRKLAIEELRLAMVRLPKKYRTVVELYYLAGLDISETAHTLKLTNQAIKTRLFRARKLLENILNENGSKSETEPC